MSDCLSDLELHFSNLASFITLLFDAYTVGVPCLHNLLKVTQNQSWGSFSYFLGIGDCVIIWICAMLLYLMVCMEWKHIYESFEGILMCQFSLLVQVEIIFSVECSSCLFTMQHVVSGWLYSIVIPILSSIFRTHLLIWLCVFTIKKERGCVCVGLVFSFIPLICMVTPMHWNKYRPVTQWEREREREINYSFYTILCGMSLWAPSIIGSY